MSDIHGTAGEERTDFTKAESRSIRRRSLRLLGSLMRPERRLIALTIAVIVVSTAAQVAGPADLRFPSL